VTGTGSGIAGDEHELLASTLDRAVESAAGRDDPAAALDASLRDIGWHLALAEDPRVAVSLLFELQGRHGVTSCALDAVMARGLRGDTDRAGGAEDDAGVAVVLPPIGSPIGIPPGRVVGSALDVSGLATRAVRPAAFAWVSCCDDEGVETSVTVPTASLDLRQVHGLDPDLGLTEVRGDGLVDTELLDAGRSWSGATRLGRLALSHELAGASRTMVRLARDHATDRIQFGRPIAGFQAVRHRLAEALVAVEAAEAAIEAAWDDGGVLAASVAKAVAGRSALVVARHAQQVLAGIGFTTEHPLHRFVRRALVLDGLLGDARSLQRCIGEELLASGRLPPLVAL
jgi:hypothetical protein